MFLHGAPLSFGCGSSLSYGLLHVYRTWSTYLWPSRFQQHTQSLITMETYKQMHSCISHVPYREPDLTTTTTLPKLSSSFWIWEKNINRNIQMEISSVARAIWKSLPATSHIHSHSFLLLLCISGNYNSQDPLSTASQVSSSHERH